MKDYQRRLVDYQESVRISQERSKGNVDFNSQAEGYKPPSVLSIFSVGLEYFLPNKIVTSRTGSVHLSNETGVTNPRSLLFGKIDLLFNVSFVISLIALIFMFSSITGEKEDGTLKLIISNPVPRWLILIAKIFGNYIILLIPFLLSILISMIILSTAGVVPILNSDVLFPFLIILLVSMIFILLMFIIGIFISTLTHRSITAIVIALFIWVILVLSIPKISPMIAEIIYPIESEQVFNLKKQLAKENLEKELAQKKGEIFDNILSRYNISGVSYPGRTDEEKKAMSEYDEAKKIFDEEYEKRIGEEMKKFEVEYINNCNIQDAIAGNLSRISPVSSYTYIVSEISSTGSLELENFRNNSQTYQNIVKENIYDKFTLNSYLRKGGMGVTSIDYAKGFDPRKAFIPQLRYQHYGLLDALKSVWVDILLLILFSILFFTLSYVRFNKYDVR
jgi:ABC-type transport system involved in multi-copper enzyme maturation permease subunit